MILKEFNYNLYNLRLFHDGQIRLRHYYYPIFMITNIADVPIINELMKELLEYYVEWKRNA